MKSLGLIETKGLLPAIECADVMLKAANVRLLGRTCVGAGLVSVSVTGDVAAVSAAVDAAKAALLQLDANALYSSHVIPRPDEEVFDSMFSSALIGRSEENKHNADAELSGVVEAQVNDSEPEFELVKPDLTKTEVAEAKGTAVVAKETLAKSEKGKPEVNNAAQKKIAPTQVESTKPETVNVESKKVDSQNIEQSKIELSKVESMKVDSTEPKKDSVEVTPELPPTSKDTTTTAVTETTAENDGKHSGNDSEKTKPALPSAGQTPPVSKPENVKAPVMSKGAVARKKDVDALWTEQGADGVAAGLTKLTLAKLRILAREYPDLPIESKKLSKVKKRTLVEVFKRYYASLNK
ncbi:Carbon dioxide-concentrating mechanism protein CcmK [Halodesulfovibrio sp. MK-HDV]|jgi:microcompartment protein CcmL/EutN|nr:Carbon dioxide-concentrating mechanism protein CcmK [Halodesulfovibrio sp. MK-HDV]